MRVLLLGAGGFLGRHTARALAAQGHIVSTLGNTVGSGLGTGFEWAEAHRAKAGSKEGCGTRRRG